MTRRLALCLCLLLAAAPAMAQPTPVKPPEHVPPKGANLQLVPVGGALDGAVKLYFETTTVKTAPDGHLQVWRLFVFRNPRIIGRTMSQAVWTLTDYDCAEASAADIWSSPLGMGLEVQRRAPNNAGSRLYNGALANAIVAEEVCNKTPAPGYRSSSVSEAVRRARSERD